LRVYLGGHNEVPTCGETPGAFRDRPETLQACHYRGEAVAVAKAQEQPLLLIFEDLHWIDGETQVLLDSFVESLPAARLLLLVNYWPSVGGHQINRIDPSVPPTTMMGIGLMLDFQKRSVHAAVIT
jgi:hypothetical protein